MRLTLAVLLAAQPAFGVSLWSSADGSRYWALDTALKWSALSSYAPDAPLLYPKRWSAVALGRGRLALRGQAAAGLHVRLAYEQRVRAVSTGAGAGGGAGILVPESRAPYRLRQLDDALARGDNATYRHELDRAFVAWGLGRGELQIGRQAIGWGRGVLFGAVDIFAPFNPLESDREWRRGVDAVRVSVPLADRFSLDAVVACGESVDESAFVGRLYGHIGALDGELLLGRRRGDRFVGTAASMRVRGAEIHGELASFKTPATEGGEVVLRALLGGSYAWDAQGGLLLVGEYHFSGFGVSDIAELAASPYLARLIQGDAQILGRHAGAVQLSQGITGTVPRTLGWLFSPIDGSGVLTGAVTWIFSDELTLAASAYWPYGAGPSGAVLRSEYGGGAKSGLVQISFYY